MSAIPKDGYKPSPVYEAVLSDGEKIRLSFYCSTKRPIDFAAGRRAMEAIALSDNFRRACPEIGESGVPTGKTEMREAAVVWSREFSPTYRADIWVCRPKRREGVSIVSAHVEHPTIGRVAHDPLAASPVAVRAKRKAPAPSPDLARLARMLCEEFEGRPNSETVFELISGMRAELGLAEIGGRAAA